MGPSVTAGAVRNMYVYSCSKDSACQCTGGVTFKFSSDVDSEDSPFYCGSCGASAMASWPAAVYNREKKVPISPNSIRVSPKYKCFVAMAMAIDGHDAPLARHALASPLAPLCTAHVR